MPGLPRPLEKLPDKKTFPHLVTYVDNKKSKELMVSNSGKFIIYSEYEENKSVYGFLLDVDIIESVLFIDNTVYINSINKRYFDVNLPFADVYQFILDLKDP